MLAAAAVLPVVVCETGPGSCSQSILCCWVCAAAADSDAAVTPAAPAAAGRRLPEALAFLLPKLSCEAAAALMAGCAPMMLLLQQLDLGLCTPPGGAL